MKKRKLELYITGKLMSALMVGRPAIFSTGGEMYHTAPVVKIHETETQEIFKIFINRMHYCIPKPSLEINSVTATAKIAEVTLYAIGSLKNSNRHAESITIANLNFTSLRTATSSSAFK